MSPKLQSLYGLKLTPSARRPVEALHTHRRRRLFSAASSSASPTAATS